MEFLERLRKKPQHVRARVAFGSAVGITAIIALVWSTTLPARFANLGSTLDEGTQEAAAIQGGFDTVLQNMGENLETAMEEEKEENVEVDTYTIDQSAGSMTNLEGWDTEGSQEPEPTAPSEVKEEEAEAVQSPPQGQVILIGTTSKKTE